LDLEGANYKVGEAIRNIRIDTCDSKGESVTIDYIYLCDSINEDLLDYDVDLINANNTYIDAAVGTIERTPESIKITSKGYTNDASRMSVAINGASVGKYLVFTYRYAATNQKNANLAFINTWTSTTNGGPAGGDDQKVNVIADGSWHTVVVDISKNKTVTANADGTYSLKYLALDVFSTASACNGDYLEISYIGFSDNLAEITDACGDVKYSLQYQLNNTVGTVGSGQVHSQIPSSTTATRSESATNNTAGFATVDGKITELYYQITTADGRDTGWVIATTGIYNPGDEGYDTYNSNAGTAQTIWLGTGGNIENAATYTIPASAFKEYSAGDVITVRIAARTEDMAEGTFAVLVSCTMTITK
jgi:hypothetical protein